MDGITDDLGLAKAANLLRDVDSILTACGRGSADAAKRSNERHQQLSQEETLTYKQREAARARLDTLAFDNEERTAIDEAIRAECAWREALAKMDAHYVKAVL